MLANLCSQNFMFEHLHWQDPLLSCSHVTWECVLLWIFLKRICNGNIFPAFRKVIPSLSYSETEVIKALGIRDCAFRNFVDYTKNMVVGDFRGNLGIHPIKAFSGDWLLWFGHKIEIPFNYHNIFLLKKQNQYASKSNCVKFLYLQYSYIFTPLRAYKRVHNHWTKNLL